MQPRQGQPSSSNASSSSRAASAVRLLPLAPARAHWLTLQTLQPVAPAALPSPSPSSSSRLSFTTRTIHNVPHVRSNLPLVSVLIPTHRRSSIASAKAVNRLHPYRPRSDASTVIVTGSFDGVRLRFRLSDLFLRRLGIDVVVFFALPLQVSLWRLQGHLPSPLGRSRIVQVHRRRTVDDHG